MGDHGNKAQTSDTEHGTELHKNKSLERPPDISCGKKVQKFLWDSDEKKCCTRTPLNWFTIVIYYTCFVGVLTSLFILTIYSVELFVGEGKTSPQFTLNDSPIGSSPALNFLPQIDIKSPLIWLSTSNQDQKYIQEIDNFLKSYSGNKGFDIATLGVCSKSPYGYDSSLKPCIYLRLNRIIHWKPEKYTSDVVFPEYMPTDVQEAIKKNASSNIFVWCMGTNPKDREHLKYATFTYLPSNVFPANYYPFRESNYVDPIIAVQIPVPEKYVGLVSGITCWPWAKNIKSDESNIEVLLYPDK